MAKNSSRGPHVKHTTHYDGGGGNKIEIPASEFLDTRTITHSDGSSHREALVQTGGDGGGKTTEWRKISE